MIDIKTFDELDKYIPGFFDGLTEQIKRARSDYGRFSVIRNHMRDYLSEHCADETYEDPERIIAYCALGNYVVFDRSETDYSGQTFRSIYDMYLMDYSETDISLWSMTDLEVVDYMAQRKRYEEEKKNIQTIEPELPFDQRRRQEEAHEEYARANVDQPRLATVSVYVKDFMDLCCKLASEKTGQTEHIRIFSNLLKVLDSLLEKEVILIGSQKVAVTDCYYTVASRPEKIPADGHQDAVWKMVFDSLGAKTLYIAYVLYMTDSVNAMRRHQHLLGLLRRMYIHIKLHLYDKPLPISEDAFFYYTRLEAGKITNEMTIAEAVCDYVDLEKLKKMSAEELCHEIDELVRSEFDRVGPAHVPEELVEMRTVIRGFDAITDEVMVGGLRALNGLTYSDFRIEKDEEIGYNETADLVTRCSCSSGAKKYGDKKIDIFIGSFDTVISHVYQDNWLDDFEKELFSDRFVHRSESNYALGPVRRLTELKSNMYRRAELYSESVEDDPFADMLYYESDIFEWEETEADLDHQICLEHARESLTANISNFIGSVIEDVHSRMKEYALILEDLKMLSGVWPEYEGVAGIGYTPECIGRLEEYRDKIYA